MIFKYIIENNILNDFFLYIEKINLLIENIYKNHYNQYLSLLRYNALNCMDLNLIFKNHKNS